MDASAGVREIRDVLYRIKRGQKVTENELLAHLADQVGILDKIIDALKSSRDDEAD